MSNRFFVPTIVALIVATSSFTLFSKLASEDTTLQSFLSGVMVQAWGGSGDNQLIRINLYNMQLALYEDGELYKIARIAAAGNPNDYSRTPIGSFRILSKERSHTSRLSGAIMPWSMRFHQGYYLHDIPTWPNGQEITTRYSLGCVRLSHELAPEVYAWTRIGAHVETYWANLVMESSSPRVYFLTEDGYRQPIANPRAFESRGFRWDSITVIPSAELAAIPLGATLY